jgi:hypothetical protein
MATVFLRLLAHDDKHAALAKAVERLRDGEPSPDVHVVDSESFRQVPGSPFAYWVSEKVRTLFIKCTPIECGERAARITNETSNDQRWIRATWEVPWDTIGRLKGWVPHAKGGDYSHYYFDLHLLISWNEALTTYNGYEGTVNRPDHRPASSDYFFRPGISWARRTVAGLSLRALPAGSIFGNKGPAMFVGGDDPDSLLTLLAITNSRAFRGLVELQMTFGSYEVGVIQRTPIPDLPGDQGAELGDLALSAVESKRFVDSAKETSHVYHLPALLQVPAEALADGIAAWQARVANTDRLEMSA